MKLSHHRRYTSAAAISALVLVITSVLFLLSACGSAQSTNAPGASAVTATPTVTSGDTSLTVDTVPRVTVEELLQKMETGANILVVDTRERFEYDGEHIKGAVSAPFPEIASGEWVPPGDAEIIFYCA